MVWLVRMSRWRCCREPLQGTRVGGAGCGRVRGVRDRGRDNREQGGLRCGEMWASRGAGRRRGLRRGDLVGLRATDPRPPALPVKGLNQARACRIARVIHRRTTLVLRGFDSPEIRRTISTFLDPGLDVLKGRRSQGDSHRRIGPTVTARYRADEELRIT